MWIDRYAAADRADTAAKAEWPDGGPWRLLVARDGTLLVVTAGQAPPRRDVFPVAGAATSMQAWALALLLGHRLGHNHVRVDAFPGTIGAAMELRALLARRRGRVAVAP